MRTVFKYTGKIAGVSPDLRAESARTRCKCEARATGLSFQTGYYNISIVGRKLVRLDDELESYRKS
jgi:hypothetical protein